MEFYLFDLEGGFSHFALIYANNEDDATRLYKRCVGDNKENMSPKVIPSKTAFEVITLESILFSDLDRIVEKIEEAQCTKKAMLVIG